MVTEQTIPLGISAKNWFFTEPSPDEKNFISPEQILSEASLAGFSGIDPCNLIALNDEALRHASRLRKLKISGYNISLSLFSQSYQESYQQISQAIKRASYLQASYLNISLTSAFWQDTPIKFYRFLNQAGRFAAEKKLHLCFRPQINTPFSSCEELEALLFHTDEQNVSLCYDMQHFLCANEDIYLAAKNFASRIGSVYLTDTCSGKPPCTYTENISNPFVKSHGLQFTMPGEGCLSFDLILSNLKLDHYKGWILVDSYLQNPCIEPFEYALKGIYYLHTLLGYSP